MVYTTVILEKNINVSFSFYKMLKTLENLCDGEKAECIDGSDEDSAHCKSNTQVMLPLVHCKFHNQVITSSAHFKSITQVILALAHCKSYDSGNKIFSAL